MVAETTNEYFHSCSVLFRSDVPDEKLSSILNVFWIKVNRRVVEKYKHEMIIAYEMYHNRRTTRESYSLFKPWEIDFLSSWKGSKKKLHKVIVFDTMEYSGSRRRIARSSRKEKPRFDALL